ncbi:helix-turn-helix domain-containing protein [Pseudomonas sp. LS1212]|uniref:helix-turn-helix domain-containing protein n=1 Tax=Pseudomonas sp. LS1212 TaxID=2972478 RepID=UPI00215C09FD|nr:helix-turn-helix domain-containing protein [Pseudomonas sp. LS1212]UVJ45065.1 helix-turn-helix domain-containing protein [Pseudomonas sp. LS1212]
MEQLKQLFSPNNAADVLDLSRSKVYDLMKRGLLHYVMVDSDRRIPLSEIERIAAEGVPSITKDGG